MGSVRFTVIYPNEARGARRPTVIYETPFSYSWSLMITTQSSTWLKAHHEPAIGFKLDPGTRSRPKGCWCIGLRSEFITVSMTIVDR
jgi:hypothetical protein